MTASLESSNASSGAAPVPGDEVMSVQARDPAAGKRFRLVLGRSDENLDRVDTPDLEAAASVVRAWERDRGTKFITIQPGGSHVVLIYARREDVGYRQPFRGAAEAPRPSCEEGWCPFQVDARYSDICTRCPGSSASA